jgi:glycine reductase
MMRVIHYLNQFFGGIGGEDQAEYPLTVTPGPLGPGRLLAEKIGAAATIVATIVCGDNTSQYSPQHIKAEIAALLEQYEADALVAGPAFTSGRYGLACAEAAEAAQFAGIKAVVGMHPENPGVNLCPAEVLIIQAGESAMDMLPSMDRISAVIKRLAGGEALSPDEVSYCIKRDIRLNVFSANNGAQRAVGMLLSKIQGRLFASEQVAPRFPRVDPAAAIEVPLSKISLISTGGLVPKGNPDRLESSSAAKWLSYSIAGRASLEPEEFECIHGGIDVTHINNYPNRLIPLDICSEFRAKGLIGALDDEYYVTVGNLTPMARAEQFAIEITAKLREKEVTGAILTSS